MNCGQWIVGRARPGRVCQQEARGEQPKKRPSFSLVFLVFLAAVLWDVMFIFDGAKQSLSESVAAKVQESGVTQASVVCDSEGREKRYSVLEAVQWKR